LWFRNSVSFRSKFSRPGIPSVSRPAPSEARPSLEGTISSEKIYCH
jgi:hypothetical protein